MIHSFSVKNFYSFGENTEIVFAVNENAPKNDSYFTTPSGTRLSKVGVVIGPNASGKTNLMKTLPFFKWLVTESFNLNPQAPIAVQPFAFNNQKIKPTDISVTFEVNGNIFVYQFSLTRGRILTESLTVNSLVTEKRTTKNLFLRKWDKKKGMYILKQNGFDLPKEFLSVLRPNASVVSTAAQFNHKESQEIMKFWQKVETNTKETGSAPDPLSQAGIPQWFETLMYYSEDTTQKTKAEKLLARFDLGLDGINILRRNNDDGSVTINAQGVHIINNEENLLDMRYESAGTKRLFIILKTVLNVLDRGGVAVLDEIDLNLHPEIVSALQELFIHQETNPKNAQIIMSTHSHIILSKLDKYQIILVEKNELGLSEAWKLADVGGLRADENYYAKYLAGAYGATPKI